MAMSGISKPMVCMPVAFHENDGNHENDEDNSDSHKQGVECWIHGNRGKHGKMSPQRLRNARFVGNETCAQTFSALTFLNTPQGSGTSGKIPGTSQIPLFETQGRRTFEGGHELFGHHPFRWRTPTPPGGLRTQKVNLCALSSFLSLETGNPGFP